MVRHLSGPQPLDDPRPGVTFAVDTVEPAAEGLPVLASVELFARRLDTRLLADDLGADEFLQERPVEVTDEGPPPNIHPFAEAVDLAFGQHRPLIISPDVVWLTIAQGIATHVNLNAEVLRDQLVGFDGKQMIAAVRGQYSLSHQTGDWAEIIDEFAAGVAAASNIDALPPMLANFSTTTPASRVASQVCMLETLSPYFDLVLIGICGFVQITVLGTEADWRDIRARVDRLPALGLGWWSEHLIPICDGFIAAAAGAPDIEHWRRMYKPEDAYAEHAITGWFAKLFPYVIEHAEPSKRNPVLTGEGDSVKPSTLPRGLSRATIQTIDGGLHGCVDLVAGFCGVRQAPETLALEPIIGWAVTPTNEIHAALAALASNPEHEFVPRTEPVNWLGHGIGCAPEIEFFDRFEQVRLFASTPERCVELDGPFAFRDVALNPAKPDERWFFYVIGRDPHGRELRLSYAHSRGFGYDTQVFVLTDSGRSKRILAEGFTAFLSRCISEGAFWLDADGGRDE